MPQALVDFAGGRRGGDGSGEGTQALDFNGRRLQHIDNRSIADKTILSCLEAFERPKLLDNIHRSPRPYDCRTPPRALVHALQNLVLEIVAAEIEIARRFAAHHRRIAALHAGDDADGVDLPFLGELERLALDLDAFLLHGGEANGRREDGGLGVHMTFPQCGQQRSRLRFTPLLFASFDG